MDLGDISSSIYPVPLAFNGAAILYTVNIYGSKISTAFSTLTSTTLGCTYIQEVLLHD